MEQSEYDHPRRPGHPIEGLEPEVGHHAARADGDERQRPVVAPCNRDRDSEDQRRDHADGPQNGPGDPPQSDEVHHAQHPRMVEEAAHPTRIDRHHRQGHHQRHVRQAEVPQRQSCRRQEGERSALRGRRRRDGGTRRGRRHRRTNFGAGYWRFDPEAAATRSTSRSTRRRLPPQILAISSSV